MRGRGTGEDEQRTEEIRRRPMPGDGRREQDLVARMESKMAGLERTSHSDSGLGLQ